jgi:hypothetical protein
MSRNRRDGLGDTRDSTRSDFDAFLSHSSNDKSAARNLKHVLEARGLTIWFEQGLERAGCVVVAVGSSGKGAMAERGDACGSQ